VRRRSQLTVEKISKSGSEQGKKKLGVDESTRLMLPLVSVYFTPLLTPK
jgi:hypothetical protein